MSHPGMELHVTNEERELLVRVLERAAAEERVEVRRTSTPAYHDQLKAEVAQLQQLLGRLRQLGEG